MGGAAGQLGLAIGGGLAGSQVAALGSLGGPIGFVAGSLLGAWLFAPNTRTTGPRLDDLTVTTSTYGKNIPLGYGTFRMSGNIIWSENIKETRNKRKLSAKGGSVTKTTFIYTISVQIVYAGRPSEELMQMWADGKIIHNSVSSATDPESEKLERSLNFRYYTGEETQLPDPFIETVEGVGQVPGYRGVTSVVIEDLPIADFGNRIPSFTAVISFSKVDRFPLVTKNPVLDVSSKYNGDNLSKDPFRPFLYFTASFTNGFTITKLNTDTNTIVHTISYPVVGEEPVKVAWHHSRVDADGWLWTQMIVSGTNQQPIFKLHPDSLKPVTGHKIGRGSSAFAGWELIGQQSESHPNFTSIGNILGRLEKTLFITSGLWSSNNIYLASRERTFLDESRNETRLIFYGFGTIGFKPRMSVLQKENTLWTIGGNGADAKLKKMTYTIGSNSDQVSKPGSPFEAFFNDSFTTIDFNVSGDLSVGGLIAYNKDDESLIIGGRNPSTSLGKVLKWDIDTETIIDTLSFDFKFGSWPKSSWAVGPQDGILLWTNGNRSVLFDVNTMEIVKDEYVMSNWSPGASLRAGYYDKTSSSITWGTNTLDTIKKTYLDRFDGGSETLQVVTEDICERETLVVASDINATALSIKDVTGFIISSQTSGANALRVLFDAYACQGWESDWKIKFDFLGQASSFTIPQIDLGAFSGTGEGNSSSPPELIETRMQELELPNQVTVSHIDKDRDYNIGTQFDKRTNETTNSRELFSLDFPIVFTPTEAKHIAQNRLYRYYVERNVYETTLSYKHLLLDPVDVGTITLGSTVFTARVSSPQYGANKVLDMQFIQEDAEIFTDSPVTGFGGDGTPNRNVTVPGISDLLIFDIPLLRDLDSTGGQGPNIYMGMIGYSPQWSGGVAFTSNDGVDFTDIEVFMTKVDYGVAETKLSATPNWETWDRLRTITIRMTEGTLSSATESDVLTNFSNAALLKSGDNWEVIQFATVTDNGDGTFLLEDLLRGRKGTNIWQSDHNKGDVFIVLDIDFIHKHTHSNESINSEIQYKGVTVGSNLDESPLIVRTLDSNSYKPWTVADIIGTRDGSDNLTVVFKRRTRFGGELVDGVDTVPLNEETESYEIEIVDSSGDVIRDITVTSETFGYTAAQQSGDGLTPGDDIDFKVYQMSALVGRGFSETYTV